ncbi:hypothetical protein HF209_30815 [Pseudomonas sp. WS 5096]|uniref:Conjugal transfer protein TrbI n=1 Tax=Pseudomonas cremoris TaxID=2724178 RepID=A0ABR6THE0_9PSED|nr:TrbI/VirB10 family protein [Pseudomonas cremoris]MBC2385349.1 hypothetical protein [Pseudomonas cremoris]
MSLLSADTSPSGLVTGVRSANKRPLIILGCVGTVVIMVLGMVAMERAANSERINAGSTETQTTAAPSTSSTLGDLSKQYGSTSFIAAEGDAPEAPTNPPAAAPAPAAATDAPSAPLNAPQTAATAAPNTGLSGQPLEYQQTLEAFSAKKAQLFEAALVASSSVPIPNRADAQQPAGYDTADGSDQGATNAQANLANLPAGATYAERVAAVQRAQRASAPPDSSDEQGSNSRDDSDKGAFAVENSDDNWILKSRTQAPPTPYVVRTGFVVPGIMVSGINSDLPGDIKGQVSQSVYDTATGRYCLIPQGTIATGKYNADVAFGQERVQVAWQRLTFPNGDVLNLGSMTGADSGGLSGLHDLVDNHWGKIFGAAMAMSVISAGYSLSQDNGSSANGDRRSASSSLSEGLGQNLGNAGTQVIQKNLAIQPTNLIRAGMRFNIMVQKDLVFSKPYAKCDTRRASR